MEIATELHMGKKAQKKREQKELAEKQRKEYLKQVDRVKNPWENFWRRVDFWVYMGCLILAILFPFVAPSLNKNAAMSALAKSAVIHTSMGDIEVELYKKDAPKTVENFTKLSQKGYYDNLTFHRVIKGFMIQGGDPTGDGTGGESAFGPSFEDEINPTSLGLTQEQISALVEKGYTYNSTLQSHKMDVGSLAMANSGPNTNGSQFFIVTEKAQPHLDGQHTVFGKVTKGLDIAVKISEVEVDENDKPKEPVYITSVETK